MSPFQGLRWGDVDEGCWNTTKFEKMAANIMLVLQQLKDDSLKSFWLANIPLIFRFMLISLSWELGTCVPGQVLGPSGYLPIKQVFIEAITLNTRSHCDWWRDAIPYRSFTVPWLQRINWIGLEYNSNVQSLRRALIRNSKHLTHLRVEFVQRPEGEESGIDEDDLYKDGEEDNQGDQELCQHNFFAREVLGLKHTSISRLHFLNARNFS